MSEMVWTAIYAVVVAPPGLAVSFLDLVVYRLEDGRYAVNNVLPDGELEEHVWATAAEAVDDFMAQREAGKLGYDFEKINT